LFVVVVVAAAAAAAVVVSKAAYESFSRLPGFVVY
jgi:hypothetical protein